MMEELVQNHDLNLYQNNQDSYHVLHVSSVVADMAKLWIPGKVFGIVVIPRCYKGNF